MSNLIHYLKQEGFKTTFMKVWKKIFYHSGSSTVFLRACSIKTVGEKKDCVIELTNENLSEFEKIKFWSFIHGIDYINNSNQSIIILKCEKEYIGYAAEEHEKNRIIHGLGSFMLQEGEGWIGPVYIKKNWRGQGYNNWLLYKLARQLQSKNIRTFYTSINSLNSSSLKSFKRAGFEEIGAVDAQGDIIYDPEHILTVAFHKAEKV